MFMLHGLRRKETDANIELELESELTKERNSDYMKVVI